jgi:serine phosphatase RsbU (regulator of sigma subunit)
MTIIEAKKKNLFNLHPLVRYNFWGRQIYCILAIMPVFSVFDQRDLAFHFYLIFFLLNSLWPSFAYLIAYISKNPRKFEILFTMHFEAFFFGAIWVPICLFNPIICLFILIATILSAIFAGGISLLVTRTVALIFGSVFGGVIFGFHFSSITTLTTTIWASIGILGGTFFLSFLFVRTNKLIILTRKKLKEQKAILDKELEEAASYVKTMLPPPIREGPVQIDWRFFPSASLGGDAFGYQWLDDDHFAFYLLDVSGHGVGAALLSASVINVIRSQSLPKTDFKDPVQVLKALNLAFPSDANKDMFFTIWYGVFNKKKRELTYASAGHPPAILCDEDSSCGCHINLLKTPNFVVGGIEGTNYVKDKCEIHEGNSLYIFSDGVYEVEKADGTTWRFGEFANFIKKIKKDSESVLDRLYEYARRIGKSEYLEDDFTIVEVVFG